MWLPCGSIGRRFLDIPIDEAVQANNRLFFIKLCSKVFNLHPKRLKTHGLPRIPTHRVGQGGGGGSDIPVYSKKIRHNTLKYPKFIQIIPKIILRYTLYLKFKESDIPDTRI